MLPVFRHMFAQALIGAAFLVLAGLQFLGKPQVNVADDDVVPSDSYDAPADQLASAIRYTQARWPHAAAIKMAMTSTAASKLYSSRGSTDSAIAARTLRHTTSNELAASLVLTGIVFLAVPVLDVYRRWLRWPNG